MSNYAEELRCLISENIVQARRHKDRIEVLECTEALDEIEKLSPLQIKTILQLYVMEETSW